MIVQRVSSSAMAGISAVLLSVALIPSVSCMQGAQKEHDPQAMRMPSAPWGMYGGDQQSSHRSRSEIAEEPVVLWKRDLGYAPTSSLLVDVSDRAAVAVRAKTGAGDRSGIVVVNHSGDTDWEFLQCMGAVSSMCAGDQSNLYVTDGSNRLYCIDRDGELLWQMDDLADDALTGFSRAKTDETGRIIQLLSNPGMVRCVSSSGEELWRRLVELEYNIGEFSYPAVDDAGNVYCNVATDQVLVKIDGKGNLVWEVPTGQIVSNPVCTGNTVIFAATSELVRISTGGDEEWRTAVAGIAQFYCPAVDEAGAAYIFAVGGVLHRIDARGRASVLSDLVARAHPDSIGGGQVIVDSEGNLLVVASDYLEVDEHPIYCFDRQGELRWRFPVGCRVVGTPAVTSNGEIYLLTAENELVLLGQAQAESGSSVGSVH